MPAGGDGAGPQEVDPWEALTAQGQRKLKGESRRDAQDYAEPAHLTLARFIRIFGADFYRSPLWPTRDQVIPWRAFVLLSGSIRHLAGLDRMVQAEAVAAGIGMGMGGKEEGKLITRRLVDEAFPGMKGG